MECFIVENGIERKAKLEDILPLITDRGFQSIILKGEVYSYVYLSYALAHMTDEIKEIVYRNMSSQVRNQIEEDVKDIESRCEKDSSQIQGERTEVMSFIEMNLDRLYELYEHQDRLVWKEAEPKEKQQTNPVEVLIKEIEDACSSKELCLASYKTEKISKEDLQNAFAAFRSRKNELQSIRNLSIAAELLPAAAPLFETATLDTLSIDGEFTGTWPEFMGNCGNLTSIKLGVYKVLTEFPSWIRNAVSLRNLYISFLTKITFIPDWIVDLQSLTEIDIWNKEFKTLPDSIGNLRNLSKLMINSTSIEKLPDSIGNLCSLKELLLIRNENLTSLPDSIGNLGNLVKIDIRSSAIQKLPDSIGNLFSLKELILDSNKRLTVLPDSMGNLKNLAKLVLYSSPIQVLPGWIGNLQGLIKLSLFGTKIKKLPDCVGNLGNLLELSLENCENLRCLPDSIGRLKNLTTLNICGSAIDKFPDTIAGCSSLECIDVRDTSINSFPDFISSIKRLIESIDVIPEKRSISYLSFCNCYYNLVEIVIQLADKAKREGILALKEDLDDFSDDFFKAGITLVVDGTDAGILRELLTIKIEREQDYYRKRFMEIAMEGILCIHSGYSIPKVSLRLALMVDIKNNPLDNACAKYFAGDHEAFNNIDLKAALLPEEEREEIRFIKRALKISEIGRQEGPLAIEKHLDHNGIAARDVFEYGLSMAVIGMGYDEIDKNLTMLIAHETDPVRKNLSLAKKHAVRSIYNGDNPYITKRILLCYFDNEFAKECLSELEE
jgi:Leucine-rich repeat (LRR) protein